MNELPSTGLLNLRGHVHAQLVELPHGYLVRWACPYCRETLEIDAVEYLVSMVIEDGRTAFATCMGRDYAIFTPRVLPVGFWEKYPRAQRPQ